MYFSQYHYSPAEYAAYDPSSRAVAQWLIGALRTHLSSSLDRNFNAIVPVMEHIGSTALGVAGKGIVDIALYLSPSLSRASTGPILSHSSTGPILSHSSNCSSLSSSSTTTSFNTTLENLSHTDKVALITRELTSLGFVFEHGRGQFKADRPRLDVSVESAGTVYKVHCHLLIQGSIEQQKQRYFRQRLLMSPVLRQQYAHIKQNLISAGITEHQEYGLAKSHFVKSILTELDAHLWSHTKAREGS